MRAAARRRAASRGTSQLSAALTWNWISATLAFSMREGPPAARAALWSSTSPSTIWLSSMVPPGLLTTCRGFKEGL